MESLNKKGEQEFISLAFFYICSKEICNVVKVDFIINTLFVTIHCYKLSKCNRIVIPLHMKTCYNIF